MTTVEIGPSHLRVEVEGFDKVLALRSSIEIPIEHVRGASRDPAALHEPRGLRLLGTSLPGVVVAGSFYGGQWLFMDVHEAERAIKIDLDHEHYAALVVEVQDPVATVEAINAAVRGRAPEGSQG
jgi:hypothetical protein